MLDLIRERPEVTIMKRNKEAILTRYIRLTMVILIAVDILLRHSMPASTKALFISGLLALEANQYWRNKRKLQEQSRLLYCVSMAASIVGTTIYITQLDTLATNIYYVFPVLEIFLGKSLHTGLLVFHFLMYLASAYVHHTNLEVALMPYLAMMVVVYLFRSNHLQQIKAEQLNAELAEANAKLLDYSHNVRDMTIVKERTRIAQELHDSIGHSLVALRMHLEYAENEATTNPAKAKEVIAKSLTISQRSISDLRKAVAVLQDNSSTSMQLQQSLQELAAGMEMGGSLIFQLDFDPKVEHTKPEIKDCIYKTVREAVTNGVKHGRATSFQIAIAKQEQFVRVAIENNGEDCLRIAKSNGLRGIEERIAALGGTVHFHSGYQQGFAVYAELPNLNKHEGEQQDD